MVNAHTRSPTLKPRDLPSDRFDLPSQDGAQDRTPWSREADHRPRHQPHGEAGGGNHAPDVAVARRDRRRADPDQDVVGSGNRIVDVLDLQNLGRSIARANSCLHSHRILYRWHGSFRTGILNALCRILKDWSALADDFRTLVLSLGPVLEAEIASKMQPRRSPTVIAGRSRDSTSPRMTARQSTLSADDAYACPAVIRLDETMAAKNTWP